MNFLSHFYFDRESGDAERILGGLLPDMVSTHRKNWIIRPEKHLMELSEIEGGSALASGWMQHKKIDKIFHSSDFFTEETDYLKERLRPIFKGSPIWIFVMAHILLELCLDAMLLRNEHLDAELLYGHLRTINKKTLLRFFELNGIEDGPSFLPYLDRFIEAGFLATYREDQGIIYALDRICGRIWHSPFTELQKTELETLVQAYRIRLQERYTAIYSAIESLL